MSINYLQLRKDTPKHRSHVRRRIAKLCKSISLRWQNYWIVKGTSIDLLDPEPLDHIFMVGTHDDLDDSLQVLPGIELDLDFTLPSPFGYPHLGPQKFSQRLL